MPGQSGWLTALDWAAQFLFPWSRRDDALARPGQWAERSEFIIPSLNSLQLTETSWELKGCPGKVLYTL